MSFTHHVAVGEQHGNWTVIGAGTSRRDGRYWVCRCICGAEREVVATKLVRRRSTNCGCRTTGVPGDLSPAERFWFRLAPPDTNGCRVFTGTRTRGYGTLTWQGRTARAHRVAWELTNGPIPPGVEVCHECDNPPCCEPAHLFLGTSQDNTRDREQKGRGPQGARNPRARISREEAAEIRSLRAAGVSRAEVATRYAIAPEYVSRITAGNTWHSR